MSTLRHLTSRHPNAEAAQNAVRQQSGIPMLTNFLQQQCRWPLMKALLGKFKLLCGCEGNEYISQLLRKIIQLN